MLQQLEVKRKSLDETRITSTALPSAADGEIVVAVDRFGLSANNISYGVVGEKIGYWNFFPVDDEWGLIPVWGFADVIDSQHADVPVGDRLYGYFPMASHLVMLPDKAGESRLIDGAPHRAELPAVYNSYARVAGEPHYDARFDDERMLLMPLYATSYCLYDFLLDNDCFGASQIIVSSASSKTAIGLAYALNDDESMPQAIALTSSGNVPMVEDLDVYQDVLSYDRLSDIDNSKPTTIVDMSGNGPVLSGLHAHLGENMRYTSNVGLTHYSANTMGPHFIAERSAMFFAPGHFKKRHSDWGPGELERRAFAFWHQAAVRSRDWLSVTEHRGLEAATAAYRKLLRGEVSPTDGIAVIPEGLS